MNVEVFNRLIVKTGGYVGCEHMKSITNGSVVRITIKPSLNYN